MDIRPLTETFAVSPQIAPADVPAIAAAGYATVICNRPDEEVGPGWRAEDIRRAVESAGLTFVDIPISSYGLTRADIRRQREATEGSGGPVLAYCASGTRSTITWMLASVHLESPDALIAMAEKAGYSLGGLREQLEQEARTA